MNRRSSIHAYVTAEEKAAVSALASQLGRTEGGIVRKAVALYAKQFGRNIAFPDRRPGSSGPLSTETRSKISKTKTARNAERRSGASPELEAP